MSVSDIKAFVRRLRDRFYSRDLPGKTQLGELHVASWTFLANLLGPDSIVYAAGVGRDITFERQLHEKVGCKVHLFDPSPTGAATMKLPENQIPSFVYQQVGLAGSAGTLSFCSPFYPTEGSYFQAEKPGASVIEFPCETIGNLMELLGHRHIDLLKMDIEGAEYGVVDEITREDLPIRQICVEFHPWLVEDGKRRTRRAIAQLKQKGYTMFHRYVEDYSFVRDL